MSSIGTAVTLFAGRLDFKAREANIWELLQSDEFFLSTCQIQVEDVVIRYNKGYAFITLTWAQGAQVDPADMCCTLW
jgi:hypothetical protein